MTYLDVRGYFDFNKLYDEVVDAAPAHSTLVEVGAWFGQSVIYLASKAKAARKNLQVIAVDTWRGSHDHDNIPEDRATLAGAYGDVWWAFVANTRACGVADTIVPMCLASVQAARYFKDASIFMAFLDAQHAYEAVAEDIEAWRPKVMPGGYFAGHDYGAGWPGVVKAVNEKVGAVTVYGSAWFVRV